MKQTDTVLLYIPCGLKFAPEMGPIVYINRGSMEITIVPPIRVGITGPVTRFLFSHWVNTVMQSKKSQKAHFIFFGQSHGKKDSRIYQQAGP